VVSLAGADGDGRRPRVLIVGAGFGGVGMAIELLRHGFERIQILEAASELGGTWFHNRYPGAACDVPSHLYSYSYAQRRDWSRLCSPQDEILSYLQGVAQEYGVQRLVRTGARVTECRFDESRSVWRAETESGEQFEAEALIVATGQLNRPAFPNLRGRDSFTGHSFHSSRWDSEYPLAGKRVAVVGTGASAVQFVPQIAPLLERLTVFQRTGNWMLPRENRIYPRWLRGLIRWLPPVNWLRRRYMFNYCELLTLTIRHPRTFGRLLGWRSAAFMRSQLPDPKLREKVWPNYTFGCKRVLFSSHYLPALGRPNVELVTDRLAEATPRGLRTEDGREREFDCIIWSTGFRTTEFVAPMRIHGRGGQELTDTWAAGAHAHLGMTIPNFPSLFFMYGPNTNTSGGSIIVYLEAQASYIRQALSHLRAGRYSELAVRPEVEAASDAEVQSRFTGTAWVDCDSWYRDETGRIVTNWPGYMREYLERTREFDPGEYEFRRAGNEVPAGAATA
jgi:cation diffusion facilitator CzcD-associated flavoprotein CzcO